MSERKQIHFDVPVSVAWQAGHRLYVKATPGSNLSNRLGSIQAHWDSDAKAHWTGLARRNMVMRLLDEALTELVDIRQAVETGWSLAPLDASHRAALLADGGHLLNDGKVVFLTESDYREAVDQANHMMALRESFQHAFTDPSSSNH